MIVMETVSLCSLGLPLRWSVQSVQSGARLPSGCPCDEHGSAAVFAPRHRERPHQPLQGDPFGIVPPVDDALHNVGRELGEAVHARQVGRDRLS